MSTMDLTLFTAELANGDVHEDVRITAPDRFKLERTGRANQWGVGQKDSTYLYEQQAFLIWAALVRTGAIPPETRYDDFRENLIVDMEFKKGEALLGDPTQRAATPE